MSSGIHCTIEGSRLGFTLMLRLNSMKNKRLTSFLRCRLTDDEKKFLETQARHRGVTTSTYLRQLLQEKLAHEPAA